uniref:DNA-directed RNA polymerase n=1 Tax=viral metagenome TaxID=1070528 RepID=A0A6C0J5H0_9ZZZZ
MDLHPEVKPIFRNEVNDALKQPRITMPFFTKYEFVVLMSARAQQIAEGSKPLVSLDGLRTSDPRFLDRVVRREIEQRKLPYLIRRQLPSGLSEYWSAQELELIW